MSEFTYEREAQQAPLETFEWDNTWIERAMRADLPRLLYIGDSISCGTRHLITERSEKAFLCDGYASSKALDNPFLFESIRLFTAQQNRCDAVLFNNGLHGWHLDDADEYPALYEHAVRFLREECPGVPIYLLLTTSVSNEEREARVKARNAAAREVAARYDLPVIDLYAVSVEKVDCRLPDGVHYAKAGYEAFADAILAALNQ